MRVSRTHRPLLPLAVALGLLAGHVCAAPVELPATALGTHWYTISILGQRSGWSEQSLRRTPTGYETLERTVLRVSLDGRGLTSARTETRSYDDTLRLLSVANEADQVGRRVRVVARREADRLLVTRTSPDGETRQELPVGERFGQDLHVLRALAAGEVKPGWQLVFETFDCDLGQVDEITVTATERLTTPEPGWLLGAQSKLLKVQSRTQVSDQGVILRQDVPGMMQMAMQRVSQEEALAEIEPFLLASAVPLEQNLGQPERLTQVRLQVRDGGGAAETLFPTTARQTVSGGDGVATVVVRAAATPATALQLPVTAPDLQPYLQPSDMVQSADPRVIAQAREIVGDEREAWPAARKLNQWVYRHMTKVASEPRPLSALEIIEAKRGDCSEHAVLLAALAQAAGLPVRMVAGLAYGAGAYRYHAWNEVYVGTWVEMDPTWGEDTVDAGHIQVAASALDSASLARMSLAASKTMGTLKLKVLDFAPQP
jgi:hypothetical protein